MAIINETNRNRISGAPWFDIAAKTFTIIGGAGGISSWLTLFLTRAGVACRVYDFDTVSMVNLAGQFYTKCHIGASKVQALKYELDQFSDSALYTGIYQAYDEESFFSPIMLSGFDNMSARKVFFQKWKNLVFEVEESERKNYLLVDGRLLAEQLQIFCIQGNKPEDIIRYENEYLFDDSEVADAACTFKQTSHMAAMIAGMMTGFLTNFLTNQHFEAEINTVPFFHEYLLPVNTTSSILTEESIKESKKKIKIAKDSPEIITEQKDNFEFITVNNNDTVSPIEETANDPQDNLMREYLTMQSEL